MIVLERIDRLPRFAATVPELWPHILNRSIVLHTLNFHWWLTMAIMSYSFWGMGSMVLICLPQKRTCP
jgi:hypothetical protein